MQKKKLGFLAVALIMLLVIIGGCKLIGKEYLLNVEVDGAGSVNINPLEDVYSKDACVLLTAVPSQGWQFSHWTGDANGTNTELEITMDDDKNIQAVFVPLMFDLSITVEGKGHVDKEIVTVQNNNYPYETKVKLTAVPDSGWQFSHWQGDLEGRDIETTVIVDGDKEITAVFVRKNYSLVINVVGEGTVTKTVVKSFGEGEYPFETVLKLAVIAPEGWRFSGWDGDLQGNDEEMFITMDGNKEVTALFVRENYSLVVNVEGEGRVDKDVIETFDSEYPYETVLVLNAIPAAGWYFSHWEGDVDEAVIDTETSPETEIEVVMDRDKEITAVFEQIMYSLNIEMTGVGTVIDKISGTLEDEYPEGTELILIAEPNEGYYFGHWGGDVEGTEVEINVTMDNNKDIEVVFEEMSGLNAYVYNEEGGTVLVEPRGIPASDYSGWGTMEWYMPGTEITITAVADEGYRFEMWKEFGPEPEQTFIIEGKQSACAIFVQE